MHTKLCLAAITAISVILSVGCDMPLPEEEGAAGGESSELSQEALGGATCRVIYYTRVSSYSDNPANIAASDAHPADRELWTRLRDCANANRCNWHGAMGDPESCVQRFCKKQSDQCLFGAYHNVPGQPQTAPPLDQVFTCTAQGNLYATVNGQYDYYRMTGTGKHQDRNTAARQAVDACNKGMNEALTRHAPSELYLACRFLYCQ